MWKQGWTEEACEILRAWTCQLAPLDTGTISVMMMLAEWSASADLGLSLELRGGFHLTPAFRELVQICPVPLQSVSTPPSVTQHRGGYNKLARLLEFVEDSIELFSAESLLKSVEEFAVRGSWLKVAGDDKARVLEDAFRLPGAIGDGFVTIELGTFVGYTTVRLAWRTAQHQRRCSRVISFELDAIHVLLARHILALAGMSPCAEIWAGLTYDTQARLPEAFGLQSIKFTFMDHRGTKFHDDMGTLEALGLMRGAAAYVADNVLKPGAPIFLWHLPRSGIHATTAWSLIEFLHVDAEDWMLAGVPVPLRHS
eukprot:gnl/TRDRNA2_/TRDRNA2_124489_c0_seq2.p1 gnl/TRDRNA2_/TRDRNA2_124489_c0~~gnl/TRDRNA2_/TRDRNA2_124489_c0_seq2.p1  ORF type:complete len:312 (+),score=53.94 gnl/TRDRNA2_/TRDRNA2_124489_c0_seq2:224-1159(+)